MTLAGDLLESGRRLRGVSRRELARRTGASAPGLADVAAGRKDATTARLDSLLRALDLQLALLPGRRSTAVGTGEEVRELVAVADERSAYRAVRQLAIDLAAVEPALRVALAVTPPPPTGDRRFDALLAAVVDDCLGSDGLPIPQWVSAEDRSLDEPWDVEPVAVLRPAARAATPEAFARRGIYLDPVDLVDR